MPVVPKNPTKRVSKRSGRRECPKKCDDEVKQCDVLDCVEDCGPVHSPPDTVHEPVVVLPRPIAVPEPPKEPFFLVEEEPVIEYPDELPSQPDFQPVQNELIPLPVDESSSCPPIIEAVEDAVVDIAVRVLSECGTKVWNSATKRWVKLGGKVALKAGL
jgi:hypothetical protein